MKIKNYLLSTAAAVMAFGVNATSPVAASAADVKACDLYGSGFYYLPGTETCLGVSGRVRVRYQTTEEDTTGTLAAGGANAAANATAETANLTVNGRVQFDARSQSDVGTVRGVLRVNHDGTLDTARVHIGDHLVFGEWDGFFTRHNGYGHLTIFEGPYGFYESHYAEFNGGAGPIDFTVGVETDADSSDNEVTVADATMPVSDSNPDTNNNSSTGNADEFNFYAGGKYNLDGVGTVAVHYVTQEELDSSVIGVAVDITAIDNLELRGWYHTEDQDNDTGNSDDQIVAGDNDSQWGVGGRYTRGDWSVAAGYGIATGGQERARVTTSGSEMAATDPEETYLTFQVNYDIASSLRAELGWESVEGATVADGANSTQTDTQNVRLRLIRSW